MMFDGAKCFRCGERFCPRQPCFPFETLGFERFNYTGRVCVNAGNYWPMRVLVLPLRTSTKPARAEKWARGSRQAFVLCIQGKGTGTASIPLFGCFLTAVVSSVVGIIIMTMESPPQAKRLKSSTTSKSSPTSIVTWNCNGFIPRCKYNPDLLQTLLEETKEPDMICIQEARVKASSCSNRGTPQTSEYKGAVETVLRTTFRNYQPYWSLADTRYAGTLTLIHKRLSDRPKVAFSVDAAIDLLLEKHQLERSQVDFPLIIQPKAENSGNDDNKNAKQTSIQSFFAKKVTAATINTTNTKTVKQTEHQEEGRFQFFAFSNMDVLQTYVPNHGMKPEKWEKRKQWDLQLEQFLRQRKRLLGNESCRPLLWCGDLNVAHCYSDGTHWSPRNATATTTANDGTTSTNSIYEWWTDEKKCLVLHSKPTTTAKKDPQYVGMPSFTPAERTRFSKLLEVGNLVDVWRQLHPTPSRNWDADPHWTWKGIGKLYGNRGQRLDYFLLHTTASSVSTKEVVESCEILGYGDRKGLFCGSDHCVSLLKLRRELVSK